VGFFDSLFLKCKILFWFFLHSFGTFQVRFTLQTKKNFSNKKYDAYVNCVVHRLISGQTHLWKELMLFIANLFTTKCASDELKNLHMRKRILLAIDLGQYLNLLSCLSSFAKQQQKRLFKRYLVFSFRYVQPK